MRRCARSGDVHHGPGHALAVQVALEILEDRAGIAPTIITTQYPIKKWHAMLKEPTFADAICDRMVNNAIIFYLKGESRRKNGNSR